MFPARLQQPAGKEVSSWFGFVVLYCLCARNCRWRRTDPRWNGKEGEKIIWMARCGWRFQRWEILQKNWVDVSFHCDFQLKLRLKNPWESAKGQRRKNLWIFPSLEQLRLSCKGLRGPLMVQLLESTTPGQSLLFLSTQWGRKQEDADAWCILLGVMPVGSQVTGRGPSHAFHTGKYNISCVENSIWVLGMKRALHRQVLSQ